MSSKMKVLWAEVVNTDESSVHSSQGKSGGLINQINNQTLNWQDKIHSSLAGLPPKHRYSMCRAREGRCKLAHVWRVVWHNCQNVKCTHLEVWWMHTCEIESSEVLKCGGSGKNITFFQGKFGPLNLQRRDKGEALVWQTLEVGASWSFCPGERPCDLISTVLYSLYKRDSPSYLTSFPSASSRRFPSIVLVLKKAKVTSRIPELQTPWVVPLMASPFLELSVQRSLAQLAPSPSINQSPFWAQVTVPSFTILLGRVST
jgi:hypothetical protein